MKASNGDLQAESASISPKTIGNDKRVAIIALFPMCPAIKLETKYNTLPKPQPTRQLVIALRTSETRRPGFSTPRESGNEHAIVAIDGVRYALVTSVKASKEVMLIEAVVNAAKSKLSLS